MQLKLPNTARPNIRDRIRFARWLMGFPLFSFPDRASYYQRDKNILSKIRQRKAILEMKQFALSAASSGKNAS
jgi:hypothetical protein